MTKAELVSILNDYPDDTPILTGRGYDLRRSSISEVKCDDWENATRSIDDDGHVYETPGVIVGVSIGPRF